MSEGCGGLGDEEGRRGAHYTKQDGPQFSHLNIRLSCSCGHKRPGAFKERGACPPLSAGSSDPLLLCGEPSRAFPSYEGLGRGQGLKQQDLGSGILGEQMALWEAQYSHL